MTNRWIMTVPVLSTAHISPQTATALEGGNSPAHDLGDDGFLLYCGVLSDEHTDGTHPDDSEEFPMLNVCMAWARRNGSNGWVRFADSGDVIDELPQFEW